MSGQMVITKLVSAVDAATIPPSVSCYLLEWYTLSAGCDAVSLHSCSM